MRIVEAIASCLDWRARIERGEIVVVTGELRQLRRRLARDPAHHRRPADAKQAQVGLRALRSELAELQRRIALQRSRVAEDIRRLRHGQALPRAYAALE